MTPRNRAAFGCLAIALAAMLAPGRAAAEDDLQAARSAHRTVVVRDASYADQVEEPPSGVLDLVRYTSPAGELAAYLSPDPGDGIRHPAIVWILGGFGNSIGATAWEKADPADDQSASVYRDFGIVMMYPSLRGAKGNPGQVESFYGEVDDIVAAAKFLAAQPHVDLQRIYLGGHSTGGTLALLAAESTRLFRAVFGFGAVGVASEYGAESLAFDVNSAEEDRLRSPLDHLGAVRSPTFLIEGTDDPSNVDSLTQMQASGPPQTIRFVQVPKTNHFSVLAPINRLIAEKIAADTETEVSIELTPAEVKDAVRRMAK